MQTFLNNQRRGGRILTSYQDQESPRTLTPRTVQYIHAVLRRALNQAMRWGLVSRNVATLVTPPRVTRQEIQPFTPQQARDVLGRIATHRLGPLIAVALSCGLRQGEAVGLRWADGVDLVGFVFTPRDGQPLDGGHVTRDFNTLLAAAGLPPLRFHDLRHSCASVLLAQGVSPRVVMAILGHSQISLTMNTDAHVLPSLQTEATHRMNALLWTDDILHELRANLRATRVDGAGRRRTITQ